MKFLIATNHSYMLWQFRRELISELMTQGEVVLSTPFVGHEDDFKNMGLKCIETPIDRRGINPKTDIELYHFYVKMLKEEKPDVVVTYSIKPNIYCGYACKKLRIPYCSNVQGLGTAFQKEPIATLVTKMYRIALKDAGTVFFENSANAQIFVDRKIIDKDKIMLLNGAGVNLDLYADKPYPEETDGVHFLYLGRIMKEKGCEEFFEAAKSIKSKFGEKVKFDLVGFFEDIEESEVQKLVDDGILIFHGFHSDPKPFYAAAHCVVLPSYHEGMSNVLLETASTGRALITTAIPGCQEAVDEGVNGFLCEKADVKSLEECMEKFLLLTKEEREQMGKKGREKMENEFDKNKVVNQTVGALLR